MKHEVILFITKKELDCILHAIDNHLFEVHCVRQYKPNNKILLKEIKTFENLYEKLKMIKENLYNES